MTIIKKAQESLHAHRGHKGISLQTSSASTKGTNEGALTYSDTAWFRSCTTAEQKQEKSISENCGDGNWCLSPMFWTSAVSAPSPALLKIPPSPLTLLSGSTGVSERGQWSASCLRLGGSRTQLWSHNMNQSQEREMSTHVDTMYIQLMHENIVA